MNTYQSTPDFYRDYIQHFNKNHDPKNGQFTSGSGTAIQTGAPKEFKKYYSQAEGYPKGVNRLNKKGYKQNEKNRKEAERFYGSVYYNVKKVNKNFNKEKENYLRLNKLNNDNYINERDKWLKGEGEYKGKDYYEFKDISANKYSKTKKYEDEKKSLDKLEKMVRSAAKQSPNSKKTFKQFEDINVFDDQPYSKDRLEKNVSFEDYAVKKIMDDIRWEAIKNQKKFKE